MQSQKQEETSDNINFNNNSMGNDISVSPQPLNDNAHVKAAATPSSSSSSSSPPALTDTTRTHTSSLSPSNSPLHQHQHHHCTSNLEGNDSPTRSPTTTAPRKTLMSLHESPTNHSPKSPSTSGSAVVHFHNSTRSSSGNHHSHRTDHSYDTATSSLHSLRSSATSTSVKASSLHGNMMRCQHRDPMKIFELLELIGEGSMVRA